jgi:hypothetical protein
MAIASHHGDRALLLPDNLTRQVVLCDMRDLVRKHAGQFGLRLGGEQGSGVHADETTEHRKRVDGVVADKKELAIGSGIRTGGHQTTAKPIEVVGDFGVVNVARLAQADLVENPLADFPFELRRELGTRRLTEVWKFIRQAPEKNLPKPPWPGKDGTGILINGSRSLANKDDV